MTTVAVTGAAAGIGRALALRWGCGGARILALDADGAALERLRSELAEAGIEVEVVVADLARPDGLAEILRAACRHAPLDVFVHNAGINQVGRFTSSDLARQRRVLEVNLLAPLVLTAELLRSQAIAPRGSLVFVSSLSRFVGYPGAAVYAASKDAVASYARSLAADLHARGTHVLTVYPGPTRTEHARRHSPEGSDESRRMPPEELAGRIVGAVRARRSSLVPGFANRVFAALGHLFPRSTERALKRALLDRMESRTGTGK